MRGDAAEQNMNLGFGETWRTVSGDYRKLIALPESDSNSNSNEYESSRSETPVDAIRNVSSIEVTNGSTLTVTVEAGFDSTIDDAKLVDSASGIKIVGVISA